MPSPVAPSKTNSVPFGALSQKTALSMLDARQGLVQVEELKSPSVVTSLSVTETDFTAVPFGLVTEIVEFTELRLVGEILIAGLTAEPVLVNVCGDCALTDRTALNKVNSETVATTSLNPACGFAIGKLRSILERTLYLTRANEIPIQWLLRSEYGMKGPWLQQIKMIALLSSSHFSPVRQTPDRRF
jgi:hypothetical protein